MMEVTPSCSREAAPSEPRGPVADVFARAQHEAEHSAATQQMFDRLASRYDRFNRTASLGIDQRWRRAAVRALQPLPNGPLLDLCAGTLDVSALLEESYPGREITAADFSPEMLRHGLQRGITRQTRTVVADAMALPFEGPQFAGAIASFGVRNLARPRRAFEELRRVLQPGAPLVILEFCRPERAFPRAFHGLYESWVMPLVARAVVGENQSYRYLAASIAAFLSRAELERELGLAGFLCVRGQDLWGGIASMVRAQTPRL